MEIPWFVQTWPPTLQCERLLTVHLQTSTLRQQNPENSTLQPEHEQLPGTISKIVQMNIRKTVSDISKGLSRAFNGSSELTLRCGILRHWKGTSQVVLFSSFCYTISGDRITHNLYRATQNKISCWPIAERDWDIKYVLRWQSIIERAMEWEIQWWCCVHTFELDLFFLVRIFFFT